MNQTMFVNDGFVDPLNNYKRTPLNNQTSYEYVHSLYRTKQLASGYLWFFLLDLICFIVLIFVSFSTLAFWIVIGFIVFITLSLMCIDLTLITKTYKLNKENKIFKGCLFAYSIGLFTFIPAIIASFIIGDLVKRTFKELKVNPRMVKMDVDFKVPPVSPPPMGMGGHMPMGGVMMGVPPMMEHPPHPPSKDQNKNNDPNNNIESSNKNNDGNIHQPNQNLTPDENSANENHN